MWTPATRSKVILIVENLMRRKSDSSINGLIPLKLKRVKSLRLLRRLIIIKLVRAMQRRIESSNWWNLFNLSLINLLTRMKAFPILVNKVQQCQLFSMSPPSTLKTRYLRWLSNLIVILDPNYPLLKFNRCSIKLRPLIIIIIRAPWKTLFN